MRTNFYYTLAGSRLLSWQMTTTKAVALLAMYCLRSDRGTSHRGQRLRYVRTSFKLSTGRKGNTMRVPRSNEEEPKVTRLPRGRPTKNTDGDNERPRHPYLVNADGVPVSEEQVAEMSRKARMLWRMLDADGMAPLTFGQISYKAWEYYSSIMLADKLFDFLLLCDDGEWKLREWSSKSYPSWHRHRFNKDPDDDQAKGMFNILTTASISHYHCIDSSPDPAQTSTGTRAREQHAES